jgi:hypothetical protein
MNKLFESILDFVFGAMNLADSVAHRRNDDPLVAEFKAKQRACLFSFAPIALVCVLTWAAGTIVDVVAGLGNGAGAAAAQGVRETLGYGLAALWVLAILYAAYCWVSLLAFVRRNDIA